MRKLLIFSALLPLAIGSADADYSMPERATARETKPVVKARHFLAVTAHPLATQAAHQILKQGGTAVDAAIAAQMVLTLVEPQSSGIGGGGFMLHYAARKQKLQAYDGREVAPMNAMSGRFLDGDDKPLERDAAIRSGKAVGVPGLLAMLAEAHRQHGRLSWATLFQPAIALASDGFPISPRLHRLIAKDRLLCNSPTSKEYFCAADGSAKAEGSILKNPALADTLQLIARQGPDSFYRGPLTTAMIETVDKALAGEPGLTAGDFAGYQAIERAPLCGQFRQWQVCGMPPPSAGGVALLQMLGLMQRQNIGQYPNRSAQAIHLFADIGRLAYADRDRYIADPDVMDVPVGALLNTSYLDQRNSLLQRDRSIGKAAAGQPWRFTDSERHSSDLQSERPATTHMSIVDKQGNIVALTSSIEDAFGSRLMVRGFLLNNQLSDFAFAPFADGEPVLNRVGPGKRPRSSMSPTIVLEHGKKPVIALGSAGGPNIINHVARVLAATLEWQQPMQKTIEAPNYGSRNGATELESDAEWGPLPAQLQALGHDTELREINSGIHAIRRDRQYWVSGTDPRREGVASGE